mmetsp:Transcript_4171/g.9966  ORF Transcript_4171/g.9966 Transcript_4171/m.9966 type:complete len:217 (+) Transcript_4171:442-1092(+)
MAGAGRPGLLAARALFLCGDRLAHPPLVHRLRRRDHPVLVLRPVRFLLEPHRGHVRRGVHGGVPLAVRQRPASEQQRGVVLAPCGAEQRAVCGNSCESAVFAAAAQPRRLLCHLPHVAAAVPRLGCELYVRRPVRCTRRGVNAVSTGCSARADFPNVQAEHLLRGHVDDVCHHGAELEGAVHARVLHADRGDGLLEHHVLCRTRRVLLLRGGVGEP